MLRCKPNQLAIILKSVCGNDGKIIQTLRQVGDLKFRTSKPGQPYQGADKKDVWAVSEYGTELVNTEKNKQLVKKYFGQDVDGLYADSELQPLFDPDQNEAITKEIQEQLHADLNRLLLERKKNQDRQHMDARFERAKEQK